MDAIDFVILSLRVPVALIAIFGLIIGFPVGFIAETALVLILLPVTAILEGRSQVRAWLEGYPHSFGAFMNNVAVIWRWATDPERRLSDMNLGTFGLICAISGFVVAICAGCAGCGKVYSWPVFPRAICARIVSSELTRRIETTTR